MPFMVELSVGISALIAFLFVGVVVFHIGPRFDTVDVSMPERTRGERAEQQLR